MGSDAFCLRHANMLTNYEDHPQITCELPNKNVWFESQKTYSYTEDGAWWYIMPNQYNCQLAKGVSLLTVQVDDLYQAGTDSSIQMRIYQGNKECLTGTLDNRGNDLGRNSENIYHTETLGNCVNFDLDGTEDVSIAIKNNGYDAIIVKFIKFVVRSQDEIVQMKCSLPEKGISVENRLTEKMSCRRFKIPFYANDRVAAIGLTTGSKEYHGNTEGGGGSTGPILVHLESNGQKCVTYAMRNLEVSKTKLFKEDLLNSCEGFKIEKNEVNVYVENIARDSIGVAYIQIYNYVDISSPLINCKLPEEFWRIEQEKAGPFKCSVPTYHQLKTVQIGVCDVVHAGTDSGIKLEICDEVESTNCCKTTLDSSKNDFERGDWMKFGPEVLKSCTNFKVKSVISYQVFCSLFAVS